MFEGPALWALGTAIFTGGIAWGSVKHSMNGHAKRLEKVEATSADNTQRLARVETKIDMLVERSE